VLADHFRLYILRAFSLTDDEWLQPFSRNPHQLRITVNEFTDCRFMKKMAVGRRSNYWWPHVVTVAALENEWFKFIFREYNTEDRKHYAYRSLYTESHTVLHLKITVRHKQRNSRQLLFLNAFRSQYHLKHHRNVQTESHKETERPTNGFSGLHKKVEGSFRFS
jgi:hypothetical protein